MSAFASDRLLSSSQHRQQMVFAARAFLRAVRGFHSLDAVLEGALLSISDRTRLNVFTPEELRANAAQQMKMLDQQARQLLFADLKAQKRVQSNELFQLRYKPLHDVDAEHLQSYISLFRYGIPLDELLDAYPDVQQDIDALLEGKHCHTLGEGSKRVLFASDSMHVHVDADIRDMWTSGMHTVPRGVELEKALFEQGHLSLEQMSQGHLCKARERAIAMDAQAAAIKEERDANKKRRKKVAQSSLTNKHLLGQFEFVDQLTGKRK